MVDLTLLQSVSYIAGALGVCVAAAYYVINLRISQRNQEISQKNQELMLRSQEQSTKAQQQSLETRQAQLFMQIYQSFMSSELLESEHHLYDIEFKSAEDYHKLLKDKERYKAFIFYGSWLEGLGILVKNNLIDIHLIAELTSAAVNWYWEKYHDGVMDCRTKLNWPRFYIEVEYLYNRLNEYGKAHPELGIASPKFG